MDTQTWPIADLKQNPDQELFSDLSDHAFDELVESIKKVGLRDPIVITPDGVLVSGHQRVRAYRRLGWTEIDVHVVEGDGRREFAKSNLNRHQLGQLAVARVVEFLLKVEIDENPRVWRKHGELRRRIADELGISTRHASRFLKLLTLPLPIQHAIDRELTQATGQKICKLSPQKRQAIADEIVAGGDPVEVAKRHLPSPKKTPLKPDTKEEAQNLVEALSVLLRNPEGIISAITPRADNVKAIKKALPLLAKAQSALEQRMNDNQQRLEDMFETF